MLIYKYSVYALCNTLLYLEAPVLSRNLSKTERCFLKKIFQCVYKIYSRPTFTNTWLVLKYSSL